jgi:GTP-binding protein
MRTPKQATDGPAARGRRARAVSGAGVTIRSAEFAGAVAAPGGSPPGKLPQVAFSGRSNVGKSSLINRLLGRTRSRVARVSATPGKTQEINFYRIEARAGERDHAFYLVDLPGYGFAKVPLEVRRRWRPLIESYLAGTPELRGVVQLIDARHGPSAEDHRMLQYLAQTGLPAMFALTKVDKLKSSERARQMDQVLADLGITADQAIPFSATTGEGREELLDSIESLLAEVRT